MQNTEKWGIFSSLRISGLFCGTFLWFCYLSGSKLYNINTSNIFSIFQLLKLHADTHRVLPVHVNVCHMQLILDYQETKHTHTHTHTHIHTQNDYRIPRACTEGWWCFWARPSHSGYYMYSSYYYHSWLGVSPRMQNIIATFTIVT